MSKYQCDTCRALFDEEESPQVFLWSSDIPMRLTGTVCQECYLEDLLVEAEDFFEEEWDSNSL